MKKMAVRVAGLCTVLAVLLGVWLPAPRAAAAEAPPAVAAGAYLVMDAATGQVLVAQNAHQQRYPASITKILTLALVLENVNLEQCAGDGVEVSQAAVDALIPRASMISLQPGEVASLTDLLYATQIESANDASHALAEYLCGNMGTFAQRMNEKAAQLGLSGSYFTNPSGQPDDGHYTTAYDMAAITRWALGVPGFRDVFGAVEYDMAPTNRQPSGRQFHSANMILMPYSNYYCEGVTGSKTGYTDAAQYTLVTTAKRGDTELICVVLSCAGNDDKYIATNQLLDYCFNNFRRVQLPVRADALGSVPVYGGGTNPLGEIDVYADTTADVLLHNSIGEEAVQLRYDIPESYVVGHTFLPTATLTLAGEYPQQQGGDLAAVPLAFTGLDDIVAASGAGGYSLGNAIASVPTWVWFAVGIPALLVSLVVGRILYVKRRREKRRQRRLAAARAQLPVRIAQRPPPPPRRPAMDARRPQRTPDLRVVPGRAAPAQPRRAGRAR